MQGLSKRHEIVWAREPDHGGYPISLFAKQFAVHRQQHRDLRARTVPCEDDRPIAGDVSEDVMHGRGRVFADLIETHLGVEAIVRDRNIASEPAERVRNEAVIAPRTTRPTATIEEDDKRSIRLRLTPVVHRVPGMRPMLQGRRGPERCPGQAVQHFEAQPLSDCLDVQEGCGLAENKRAH